MIISPPFLRDKNAAQSDTDWVYAMMHVSSQRGYPLNASDSWHGGIHILHTDLGASPEKVRAIADGTVVSFRTSSEPWERDLFPLKYSAIRGTDDAYVLLKHETEIGSGENGKVVFYSLYMHLKHLEAEIKADAKIYRKDPLGSSGMTDGKNEFHFQIFCDGDNIGKLTGRKTGQLDITKNGRTDAVYGDMHFYLPAGTKFYQARPADNTAAATGLTEVHTSTVPLYASMSLSKGTCTMTTRQACADVEGAFESVGNPQVNTDGEDYEYNLYRKATSRYPQSPSAGYELMRFGRIINTEHETLTPADAPLWMTVNYPGGSGVVNLAVAAVKKFSDADFPQWTGWQLIDDDKDNHSQCNSAAIRKLRKEDRYAEQSSKLICCIPFEWEKSTIDARYKWLMTGLPWEQCTPEKTAIWKMPGTNESKDRTLMSEDDYSRFKQHAEALCFSFGALGEGKVWHFDPRGFIEHFRKCGWLNPDELAATFPKYLFYSTSGNPRTALKQPASLYSINHAQAYERIESHYISLNLCIRKYIGSDKKRIAFLLPQTLLETAQWRDLGGNKRLLHEWGFGRYNEYNPATEYYTIFYGRGIMQLTWAGTYKIYGQFRSLPSHFTLYMERLTPESPRLTATSTHYTAHPDDGGERFIWSPRYDPDYIAEDNYTSCDSGGFYWVSKTYRNQMSINRIADRDFTADNVGLVNRLVNGGSNGYYERQAYSKFTELYLLDGINANTTISVSPSQKSSIVVDLTKS